MKIGRYILNRFLWLIPTILVLIWLTGLLENSIPGDPIQAMVQVDERQDRLTPMEKRERYNLLARQHNVGLPAFYFTILPANLVAPQLNDVRFQQNRKNWLRKHDKEKVIHFFNLLETQLSEIPDTLSSDEKTEWFSVMTRIGETPPKQQLNANDRQAFNTMLTQSLLTSFDEMKSSAASWAGGLAVIKWHGIENKLHNRIVRFLQFDWGRSIIDGRPVSQKISEALVWTLFLAIVSLVLSFLVALLLGWQASIRDGRWLESILSQSMFALYAVPLFWLATLFIVFLTTDEYGSWTNIFPGVGVIVVGQHSVWSGILQHLDQLILPILCMSLGAIAYFYQFVLSGQRKEKQRPYFLTALAKGNTVSSALTRHTMINSLFPLLGLMALILPGLIGGSLIVEVLFNIPGMGRLMFGAIQSNDWNVVIAVVYLSGLLAFVSMLVVDILLHYVNPKFKSHG